MGGSKLYKTIDGGNNWTVERVGTTAGVLSIDFVNDSTGYICGHGGLFYKTTDRGNSWIQQNPGTSIDLRELRFGNENLGWTAGYASSDVFITYDGGTSWLSMTLPEPAYLITVAPLLAPNYGYILLQHQGSGTSIYRFGSYAGLKDPNTVKGRAFVDQDSDCSLDTEESLLRNHFLIAQPGNHFSITDKGGNYEMLLDSGNYQLQLVPPQNRALMYVQNCIPSPGHTVIFDSTAQDTSGLDFPTTVVNCPFLTVDVASNRRRRCFNGRTQINYCNDGFAESSSAKVYVSLPSYVNMVSANHPYTIDAAGNFVFDVGKVAAGQCGNIVIIDSVSCILGITGLTQCTKAWINPPNNCFNQLDPPLTPWDSSSVTILPPFCEGDSVVVFTILNSGEKGRGDMQNFSQYRLFADNRLGRTGSFQLQGQESLVLRVPTTGQTFRLEADQSPGHPGQSYPSAMIEGCGNGGRPQTFGIMKSAPVDDADVEVEIHCLDIIDSFDPNDKQVSPAGISSEHYVKPGRQLEYFIRFQNTGTDTAYKVIVVDTLSDKLDVSTIEWGLSSHPYELSVSGSDKPILSFTFEDINLPDSTTDEVNSHGFIKFSVYPDSSLGNGTPIFNAADIYFDFNLPIRTNNAWVTIFDTTLTGPAIPAEEILTGIDPGFAIELKLGPNPFTDELLIEMPEGFYLSQAEVEIYDLFGKQLDLPVSKQNQEFRLDVSQLPPAMYVIVLNYQGKQVAWEKILKGYD